VQQTLKAKGYDPGTINGVMSQTQEALKKFQKENGLPAIGTVDAQTAKAFGLSSSASGTTSPSGDRSRGTANPALQVGAAAGAAAVTNQ
jgi:peptidoglycan hydrolase-like protein with peptidoglycan-binding domain